MSTCVGVARVGSSNQKICTGTLQAMSTVDMGPPLHSLVIVGLLHPLEQEFLSHFIDET